MTLSALRAGKMSVGSPRGRGLRPRNLRIAPPAGPPFEKGTLHLVGAKSACLRFRLRRKLRPLPCSSSPHKVLRLCGDPMPYSLNGVPAPDSISGVVSLAPGGEVLAVFHPDGHSVVSGKERSRLHTQPHQQDGPRPAGVRFGLCM